MHTCIAYSSYIILTLYFAAIIDSLRSSCVWGWKDGRLVRTDSSPKLIAKEILCKLKKSPINPLCLKAIPVEQTEEMEQQQGGNWTLEDINRALMDDMKAMMQNKLRQALAGLMPPLVTAPTLGAAIPPDAVAPVAANEPIVDAPPANNDNARGQLLNTAGNMPTVDMKFEDVENYMVEKTKKESLELVQDLESKQMQTLNQKMSKMEELMRGQV